MGDRLFPMRTSADARGGLVDLAALEKADVPPEAPQGAPDGQVEARSFEALPSRASNRLLGSEASTSPQEDAVHLTLNNVQTMTDVLVDALHRGAEDFCSPQKYLSSRTRHLVGRLSNLRVTIERAAGAVPTSQHQALLTNLGSLEFAVGEFAASAWQHVHESSFTDNIRPRVRQDVLLLRDQQAALRALQSKLWPWTAEYLSPKDHEAGAYFAASDGDLGTLIERALADSPDGQLGRWEHVTHPGDYRVYLGRVWVPWEQGDRDPSLPGFLRGADLPSTAKDVREVVKLREGRWLPIRDLASGGCIAHAFVNPHDSPAVAGSSDEDRRQKRVLLAVAAVARRKQSPLPERSELFERLIDRYEGTARLHQVAPTVGVDPKVADEFGFARKDLIDEVRRALARALEQACPSVDAATILALLERLGPYFADGSLEHLEGELPRALRELVANWGRVRADLESRMQAILPTLGRGSPPGMEGRGTIRDKLGVQVDPGPGETERAAAYRVLASVTSEIPFAPCPSFREAYFHLSSYFADLVSVCAYDSSIDLSGIDMAKVREAIPHLVESLLNHDFSRDTDGQLMVRVFAHADGVRLELLGRGDRTLPQKLTSQPWYSAIDRPWWGAAPDEVRSDQSGRGTGLRMAFESLARASLVKEVLLSWRSNDTPWKHPTAKGGAGNIVSINFPRTEQV